MLQEIAVKVTSANITVLHAVPTQNKNKNIPMAEPST